MNSSIFIRIIGILTSVLLSSCVWITTSIATTFDTNGDGVEGIAEAINALQVATGKSPANSKLIYVPAGGTGLENGQALLDAADEVNGGSEDELHFVKLSPGIYDLGARSAIFTKPVSVQGFSRYATQITSTVNSLDASIITATLQCSYFCEFRNMRILNTGSGSQVVGFYGVGGMQTEMENVNIDVYGQASSNIGIYSNEQNLVLRNSKVYVSSEGESIGIYRLGSRFFPVSESEISSYGRGAAIAIYAKFGLPVINSSSITAYDKSNREGTAIGLDNSDHCTAKLFNTRINSRIGISNYGESTLYVKNSEFFHYDAVSIDSDESSIVFAAYNQINGSVSTTSSYNCIGNYNIRYEPLDENCQSK